MSSQSPGSTCRIKSFLNVCFWNICGRNSRVVGDKFLDVEFKNICNKHGIVAFAELHSETVACMNGFTVLKQNIRKKIHKGPKIAGGGGGGVAVFVKNEIYHLVLPMVNQNEDYIWVKFSKGKSREKEDIFIGTCYISPSNNKTSHSSLENFFDEAKRFSD